MPLMNKEQVAEYLFSEGRESTKPGYGYSRQEIIDFAVKRLAEFEETAYRVGVSDGLSREAQC